MKAIILILMLIVMVIVTGCTDSKQWGRGELSAEWQSLFGNSNLSRLGFVQTQAIDRHEALLMGTNAKGKDGKAVHTPGLIERLRVLEAENPAELARRVRRLETVDKQCYFAELAGKDCKLLPKHECSYIVDPNTF